MAAISDDAFSRVEVLRQLAAIQAHVSGIGSYLSSTIPTTYYNTRRSAESTIAAEVFHIPELLELILEHASVFDIVATSQTCRGVKAIVEASPRLQTLLFLRPATQPARTPSKLTFHPLSGNPWFKMSKLSFRSSSPHVSVRFKPKPSGFLPEIGTLWKRMQICHPSLMRMSMSIECRDCEIERSLTHQMPEGHLSTGKELTFGDLYDKAAELFGLGERRCTFCHGLTYTEFSVLFECACPC